MKHIRYALEAILLSFLFLIFKIMPLDIASSFGGWLGRMIGPCLATSRKAKRRIEITLPDQNSDHVIKAMWDNIGRVVAEYPHLKTIAKNHVEIVNQDHVEKIFAENSSGIFFGGHLGNWEINCLVPFVQLNRPVEPTYRAPNNPYVDRIILKARSLNGQIKTHAKSREGGRSMIEALKNGHYLGILIDQKYNEGVAVPFLGMPAMTNPIFVQLCQKYNCPLIPVRSERLDGAHFRLTVYPPLRLFDADETPLPVEAVIKDAHALLEEWIKDKPEQWLWLHKRWDSEKTKGLIS